MPPNSPLLPMGTIAAPPAQLRMPAAEWSVGQADLKTTEAYMKVTSLGQMANHTAKHFYRMNRAIVDALVSAGEIAAEQADKEWARRVADELVRNGMKVPKAIAALLR